MYLQRREDIQTIYLQNFPSSQTKAHLASSGHGNPSVVVGMSVAPKIS